MQTLFDPGADKVMDALRNVVYDVFQDSAVEMVSDLREALSVDVESTVHWPYLIRSSPGEAPRRETGKLYNSIASQVAVGPVGCELLVYTPVKYSLALEYGHGKTLPRPHWSKLYDGWKDALPGVVAKAITAKSGGLGHGSGGGGPTAEAVP